MALIEQMVSTGTDDWRTPKEFFNYINECFNFTHDMAASPDNALCENYFTKENSALDVDWHMDGVLWCNPPFSRKGGQDAFVRKAVEGSAPTVMLLPVRTGTKRWQDLIFPNASWICFLRERLKFEGIPTKSGKPESAPFDCSLVGFNFIERLKVEDKFGKVVCPR